MRVGIVGCGYVAEFYAKTIGYHPSLELIKVFDTNHANALIFSKKWSVPFCNSLESLLDDKRIEMILNLTNPRSHFDVSYACIKARKHVYSEKPLAMNLADASILLHEAQMAGVSIACAPSSLLSEVAQTLVKAVHEGIVGTVRLVYANFDDGMIAPNSQPWNWRNESGVAWPAKDEFEVGCTFEHAGYVLTWLAAIFGVARRVIAFSSCQIPNKGIALDRVAPDFSVGCVEYANNVVARVTCGLVAPVDKSITIIGDKGTLFVQNVRDEMGKVYFRPYTPPKNWCRVKRYFDKSRALFGLAASDWKYQVALPLVRPPSTRLVSLEKRVDFCRGPSELADSIREQRRSRLSGELGAHILEIVEALQYPEQFPGGRVLTTSFTPLSTV